MDNALVRARHGLTLAEKRIVGFAASMLDPRAPIVPNVVVSTRFTALEFADTFGIDPATAYEQLQSAAKQLYSRSITFYEPCEARKGKPVEPCSVTMRWVGSVKYHKGKGWIELHWWPAVLPFLMELKTKHTTLQLLQASNLRSHYSWRLLELLMQFKGTGWLEIDIDEFTHAMEATEKQRANFAEIRRQIIEPSIRDLIEKDGWLVEWQPIKAGRKVTGLRFEFQRDPQQRLELDTPRKPRQAAAAPPAVDQQVVAELAAQLATLQQRIAILDGIGVRVMPADEIAAANAKEVGGALVEQLSTDQRATGNAALAGLPGRRRRKQAAE